MNKNTGFLPQAGMNLVLQNADHLSVNNRAS